MAQIVTTPSKLHRSQIFAWLAEEDERCGEGFYCNRTVIQRGFDESRVHCVVESDTALAFVVFGNSAPHAEIAILEVHPAHRRRGIGRLLTIQLLNWLKAAGVTTVDIQCEPRASESFWRSMGFVTVDPAPVTAFEPLYLRRSL